VRVLNYLSLVKAGEVEIREAPKPKPKRNELLIKVKACGICAFDIYAFQGKVSFEEYLEHPGHEFVGVVEGFGEEVSGFSVGDAVSGLGSGAFAEYITVSAEAVEKVPVVGNNFSVWISEPVACVVNGIRSLEIEPGDSVLLIGCGYMGLLMVQGIPAKLLKYFVVADVIEERLSLAKAFGAEIALNPRDPGFEGEIKEIAPRGFDIVIEASGAKGALDMATNLVREGGTLCVFGYHVGREEVPTGDWHIKGLKILNSAPNFSRNFLKDLRDGTALMKKGTFKQDKLITHTFQYTEAQKAFEFVASKPQGYIKGTILF
jgi:threonine dehydrogenase-like Zn-dependent dehydrogenase